MYLLSDINHNTHPTPHPPFFFPLVQMNDPESKYERQDLLSKAAAQVDRLKKIGFYHGSGSTIKDHMIVDKHGKVHLLNYRYCWPRYEYL